MSYGIIRYSAGSGAFPEEDAAAFDGWYSDKEDAEGVYDDWRERYPTWIVSLVKQTDVRFPK